MAQQVLLETSKDAAIAVAVAGRTLVSAHTQLESILSSRLGRSHGDLLAAPRVQADGAIRWSTGLAGAVVRADRLPDDERGALDRRAERLHGDIAGLAQQLQGEGAASQVVAQMLREVLRTPPGAWLFSVGGKPVLAMWGHTDHASAATPPAVAAAARVSPHATQPAAMEVAPQGTQPAAMQAMPATQSPPHAPLAVLAHEPSAVPARSTPTAASRAHGSRWFVWALLALLVLALVLWGVRRCTGAPTEAGTGIDGLIAQAQKRNAELEDELRRKRAAQMMCMRDAPMADVPPPAPSAPDVLPSPQVAQVPRPAPAPSPEAPASAPQVAAPATPAASAPSVPASAPRPRPSPRPASPPAASASQPVPPPSQPRPAPPPKTESPTAGATTPSTAAPPEAAPQRSACKPRQPGDEPEVVVIVDASGSMNKPFGSGPSRIDAAKRAAASMIRSLPGDVDVALVDFVACGQVRRDRFYQGAERGALIGEIDRLAPKQGTPLADALKRAGAVASDSAPSVLVVVSDGGDSCGGDPCAVARSIRAAKPNVTINVIDLAENPREKAALQCIAQAGGGKVLSPGDPVDMNRKMKEAAGAANCPA